MAFPVWFANGPQISMAVAVSPAYPAGIANNDVALLFVHTSNQAVATIPVGWTQIVALGTGTAATPGAVRLTVLGRRLTGSETAQDIGDSGDHQNARIVVIRGCTPVGTPWVLLTQDAQAGADTTVEIPGGSSPVNQCLIVAAVAHAVDNAVAQVSGAANASLTNLAGVTEFNSPVGTGGGIWVGTGERAVAGTVATTTATLATASAQVRASIALLPVATSVTGTGALRTASQTIGGTGTAGSVQSITGTGALRQAGASASAFGTTSTGITGFFVSTTGSAANPGTIGAPWSWAHLASDPAALVPGSQVWVRGGTYTSTADFFVTGTNAQRIVIRNYPGERATLNGHIQWFGSYTTLWGLEISPSNPAADNSLAINNRGVGNNMVNCVIHDAGMSGIGTWMEAPDSEVYGCISYNNGTHGNLDHGIYGQNSTGTKLLAENILFTNSGYGVHLYVSAGQFARDITVRGCVGWNSGFAGVREDFFCGGSTTEDNITVDQCFSYRNNRAEGTVDLGWNGFGSNHGDLTYTNNYMVGVVGLGSAGKWASITQSGNTNITTGSGTPPDQVFVRPNAREAKRGHVIVYNWSNAGSKLANLSTILSPGDSFTVRSALAPFGAIIQQGTYGGGSVSIPMTAIPSPVRTQGGGSSATIGPTFGVFIVQGAGSTGITGIGALAATTTSAGTGTERFTGTGALRNASASLAGTGSSGTISTGTLSQPNATVAGSGTQRFTGTGTLGGVSSMVGTGSYGLLGVTGTGNLAVMPGLAAVVWHGGSRHLAFGRRGPFTGSAVAATLVGTGPAVSLGGAGVVQTAGTATLAAIPSVAGTGTLRLVGSATLAGIPAVAGTGTTSGLLGNTGTGTLAATHTAGGSGTERFTGSGTLGGVTPAGAGAGAYTPLAITGAGTLRSAGATTSGVGSHAPAGFTGTGNVVAAGGKVAGAGSYTPQAITGSAGLTVGQALTVGTGSETFTGSGATRSGNHTLAGAGSYTPLGIAGVGTLGLAVSSIDATGYGQNIAIDTALLTALFQSDGTGAYSPQALTGIGALTSPGQTAGTGLYTAIPVTGTGTLATALEVAGTAQIIGVGAGSLTVQVRHDAEGTYTPLAITGMGSFATGPVTTDASGFESFEGAANLAATFTLDASGAVIVDGTGSLAATVGLEGTGSDVVTGSGALTGDAGSLDGAGEWVGNIGNAALSVTAALSASGSILSSYPTSVKVRDRSGYAFCVTPTSSRHRRGAPC